MLPWLGVGVFFYPHPPATRRAPPEGWLYSSLGRRPLDGPTRLHERGRTGGYHWHRTGVETSRKVD